MQREVWITGAGAVTPLGHSFDAFADRLLAGQSGIRQVNLLDAWGEPPCALGLVDEVPLPEDWSAEAFRALNRLDQFVFSCAARALRDAGLSGDGRVRRAGVVLGMGAERLRVWETDYSNDGGCVYRPDREPAAVLQSVQRHYAVQGPGLTVAAACASGNIALGVARGWVASGRVDICLAGSFDVITPLGFVGFNNLRALSRSTGPAEAASRPFDVERDGFVMSEGGALFVLEPAEQARQRGATPHGAVVGFGATSDASHMIIPSDDPRPASQAMHNALADARLEPPQVDYLNAHATSTPVGDRAETEALRLVFGEHLPRLPVSSTKSITGHALSGAASIEALACLVALQRQTLPATINLDTPDPQCQLNHVAHQSRPQPVDIAASNSFGFGGSNTCVLFRKAA